MKVSGPISLGLLGLSFVLLSAPLGENLRPLYDFVTVAIVFPVIVYVASIYEPSEKLHSSYSLGADLSYPIYLVHGPVFLFVTGMYKTFIGPDLATGRPMLGLFATAVALFVSYALFKYYDVPVRRHLKKIRHQPGSVKSKTV